MFDYQVNNKMGKRARNHYNKIISQSENCFGNLFIRPVAGGGLGGIVPPQGKSLLPPRENFQLEREE